MLIAVNLYGQCPVWKIYVCAHAVNILIGCDVSTHNSFSACHAVVGRTFDIIRLTTLQILVSRSLWIAEHRTVVAVDSIIEIFE